MAFSGFNVLCSFVGGTGANRERADVPHKFVWSETMSAAGTTVNVAPKSTQPYGDPLFLLQTAAAAWVSIGPAPDAINGPRFLLQVDTVFPFYADPGDRVAWTPA